MENTNSPLPCIVIDQDRRNNTLKSLPPGFKFLPEDYELIKYYLQAKLNGRPIPCDQIHDVNVYNYDPQELNDIFKREGVQDMYFFTSRNRKYPNGHRPDRAVEGFGFWKASGKETPINSNGNTIGFKRTLVFYRGKPNKDPVKTNWIMKEFTLNYKANVASSGTALPTKLDDWVLCKIYKNKSNNMKSQDTEKVNEGLGEKQSQHFEEMTTSHEVIPAQQMQIPSSDFPILENLTYLDFPPPLATPTATPTPPPPPPEISWDEFDTHDIIWSFEQGDLDINLDYL